jgi:hypothetical protein
MVTATKRAVVMVMKVMDNDEGNGESGKNGCNGDKEGNCKEEGSEQQ